MLIIQDIFENINQTTVFTYYISTPQKHVSTKHT